MGAQQKLSLWNKTRQKFGKNLTFLAFYPPPPLSCESHLLTHSDYLLFVVPLNLCAMKHLMILCLLFSMATVSTAQFLTSGGTAKATPALGVGDNPDNGIQLKVNGNSTRSGIFAISYGSNKFGVYARADNASCSGLTATSLNGIAVKGYSTNGYAGVFLGRVEFREAGGSQDAYLETNFSDPDYRLYVDKGIQTGRIKTLASLADYVFEPEYEVMPLDSVATFIEEHHHLPGVISQEEVEADGGVDLTAFTVQLQEKLEELYLHVIALNRQVQALEAENAALRVELSNKQEVEQQAAPDSETSEDQTENAYPQTEGHE